MAVAYVQARDGRPGRIGGVELGRVSTQGERGHGLTVANATASSPLRAMSAENLPSCRAAASCEVNIGR